MAGLPGTGLGGIFYALLILWMAVRETWLLARGGSSAARWRTIAWFGSLLAGIVLALWLEGWLLQTFVGSVPGLRGSIVAGRSGAIAVGALTPALAAAPFVILALMMVAMHAMRLLLPRMAADTPALEQHTVPAVQSRSVRREPPVPVINAQADRRVGMAVRVRTR